MGDLFLHSCLVVRFGVNVSIFFFRLCLNLFSKFYAGKTIKCYWILGDFFFFFAFVVLSVLENIPTEFCIKHKFLVKSCCR